MSHPLLKIPRVRRALREYLAASELYSQAFGLQCDLRLRPRNDNYYNLKAELREHDASYRHDARTGCRGCAKAQWREFHEKDGWSLRCQLGRDLQRRIEAAAPPDPPKTILDMQEAASNRSAQKMGALMIACGGRRVRPPSCGHRFLIEGGVAEAHALIEEAKRPQREADRKSLHDAIEALKKTIPASRAT